MNVDREFFGAYYMTDLPVQKTVTGQKYVSIWGTRQSHAYTCGRFDYEGKTKYLTFIRLSELILDITKVIEMIKNNNGEYEQVTTEIIEHFDLANSHADVIAQHPLFQIAVSGADMELSEDLMTNFNAPVAQIIFNALQQGMTAYQIFERWAAFFVVQFMGMTFDEVLFNYPDILVETKNIDEQGDESVSVNIWRNSQEGAQ